MAENGPNAIDSLALAHARIPHRDRAEMESSAVLRFAALDQHMGLADFQDPAVGKTQGFEEGGVGPSNGVDALADDESHRRGW
jgi:hypothetical protein